MKLAFVGAGTAGERVIDRIIGQAASEGRGFCDGDVLVFDTERRENESANIPEEKRFLIGDMHPSVRGEGVDGDVDLGVEAAREDLNEIRRAFDKVQLYDVEAIMVVAGLGGGTGGGLGAALVAELEATYDKPIYTLGILPAEDEGKLPALNASRSLLSLVPRAENVVLFDNDAWSEAFGDDYETLNEELAIRIVSLFAAGELETGQVAENLMDPTDLRRTLETGGVSSIGYATDELDTGVRGLISLLFFWRDDEEAHPSDAVRIKDLVEEATDSLLTLPCDISSAERGLFVLSGPSEHLSRKGFESARYWLEQQTNTAEIIAGDEPHEDAPELRATVLFSNVTEVPRIDAMQRQGVAALPEDQRTDPQGSVTGTARPSAGDGKTATRRDREPATDGQPADQTGTDRESAAEPTGQPTDGTTQQSSERDETGEQSPTDGDDGTVSDTAGE